MNNPSESTLHSRVNSLEATVAEIRQALLQAGLLVEPLKEATASRETEPVRTAFETPEVWQVPEALQPIAREELPLAHVTASLAADACPVCKRDNPLDVILCQWCGELLIDTPVNVETEPQRAIGASELVRPENAVYVVPPKAQRQPTPERTRAELPVVAAANLIPAGEQPHRRERKPARSQFDVLKSAEFWLNKVGIVLFLFGVIFLFRYAVDQQWLNEQARVGAGLLLGSVLMVFGLRLHPTRRHLAQVLLGGAIATYYITGYAAYNIFPDLNVPYPLALGYMTVVTLLAFLLSLRQHEAILSIIGVAGGLLTPFALNLEVVQVPGLIMYSTLIVAGASAIYMHRGWRSLLWTTCQGGASILSVAYMRAVSEWGSVWWSPSGATIDDRIFLQVGAIVGLLAFWLVPVAQEVLWRKDPARWERPVLSTKIEPGMRRIGDSHAYILAALVPPICLIASWVIWFNYWTTSSFMPWSTWGMVSIGLSAIMLGAFLLLKRTNRTLAYIHALLSVGFVTLGLVQILDGNELLLALAVEGLVLAFVARRYADKGMELYGHAIFAVLGLAVASRLLSALGNETPLTNPRAIFDLAVLGLAMAASFLMSSSEARLTYRSIFHLALMAWLWRELNTLENGEGLVMLAWAGYAVVLHLVSRLTLDKNSANSTVIAAHFAFDGALAILAYRLASGMDGSSPILNEKAGIDLLFMGLAFATSFLVKQEGIASAYRIAVHLAGLAWLWREATPEDLESGYVMLRWALYLGMLAFVSHRVRDKVTLMFVNCGWIAVALLFATRFLEPRGVGLTLRITDQLVDLAVIGLAFALHRVVQPRQVEVAYRIAAHAGVLALIWREFWNVQEGHGIVMLAWAVYATAVLVLAARRGDRVTIEAANIAFLGVGCILASRLGNQLPERLLGFIYNPPDNRVALLNLPTLLNVSVIAVAVLASCFCNRPEVSRFYRLAAHLSVLVLLMKELVTLDYGADLVFAAWAVYGAAVYFVGRRLRDEFTLHGGYATYAMAGLLLLTKIALGLIFVNPNAPVVLTARGLADLGLLGIGAAIFLTLRNPKWRLVHGLWLHVTFLGWMWQELGLFESGNAYVTIAWGVYGVILVVAGSGLLLGRNIPVILCGITTLFAIAGKLFVIDLRYLGTIWQIMLFLGFGGFFLLVSYGFQKYVLDKKDAPGPGSSQMLPAKEMEGGQATQNG